MQHNRNWNIFLAELSSSDLDQRNFRRGTEYWHQNLLIWICWYFCTLVRWYSTVVWYDSCTYGGLGGMDKKILCWHIRSTANRIFRIYSTFEKTEYSVYSVSLYRWWAAATGTVKQKAEAARFCAAEEIGDDVILQQIDAEGAETVSEEDVHL